MLSILAEQIVTRIHCEQYIDSLPPEESREQDLAFDQRCAVCYYACKHCWRFAGLVGKSGTLYTVGPLCDVLRKFSLYNPLSLLPGA